MKKILTVLILSMVVLNTWGATKFVINRGHFSPIIDIQYDAERNLIFSAEERGAVSIWDVRTETLRNHFQLTSNTIDKILISPNDSNVAVLSHDAEKYYLSVWDWTAEKKVFSRIIEEQPLFLEYSATGRYIFYGNVSNPSLTFLNARTGVQLNYMDQLPYIYDFGYLAPSERNLMTYSSSGSIRFYDFRTSAEKLNVSTVNGLKDLNIIQSNNAVMSGIKGNRLYLIERLTGRPVDMVQFQELKAFYQDPENGYLLTLERSNRNYILKKWMVRKDDSNRNNVIYSFIETEEPIIMSSSINVTSLIDADGLALAGDANGSLYKTNWIESRLEPFSIDNSKEITDLTINDDTLTLAGNEELLCIKAPFFQGIQSSYATPDFSEKENPLSGNSGMIELEDGKTLLWTTGNDLASIAILENDTSTISFEYSDFTSPLQDIAIEDNKIITLEKNGKISIIDKEDGSNLFSYSAIGLQNISLVDERTLFAGRSSTAGKSPAITIDLETRETLTVDDDRFLIFDSISVEESKQFYSLGLLDDEGKTKTILKSHNYENLNESETILIYTGEDINAQVLIDPKDHKTIYAKLGTSGIYKITGRNVTKYDNNKPVKKIFLEGSIIYSLNEDNSITMFKASTGRKLYSIHVFDDDTWALIPSSSDVYFGSEGVEENIISYRNNRRINLKPINEG